MNNSVLDMTREQIIKFMNSNGWTGIECGLVFFNAENEFYGIDCVEGFKLFYLDNGRAFKDCSTLKECMSFL